jgi:geranylgeranyl diphosphate synthase type II
MSAIETTDTSFDNQLRQKAQLVNNTLQQLLTQQTSINSDLKKAIEYTLQGKGKRIRAAVLLWCCELVSGKINQDAEIAAAAVEMVHTYSLVHDDLPAMDDDDLRRGRPTCHKAFDEATAILTGDALLTLAFEVLANRIAEPAVSVKLISQLAAAAGPAGMIAGQAADLKAENGRGTQKLLEYIHTNKTAKMFRCAGAMGAICGQATEAELERLCEYGLKIGLAFQIADDILDVSASTDHLGKTAGKDTRAAKCTYPSVLGLEKSRQLQQKLTDEAVGLMEHFGQKADALRSLATALLRRTK